MKEISILNGQIKITLNKRDPDNPDLYIAGIIESDIFVELPNPLDLPENEEFNAALNTLEAMILACAIAGIEVDSPAFEEAIETVIDKINNKYGD